MTTASWMDRTMSYTFLPANRRDSLGIENLPDVPTLHSSLENTTAGCTRILIPASPGSSRNVNAWRTARVDGPAGCSGSMRITAVRPTPRPGNSWSNFDTVRRAAPCGSCLSRYDTHDTRSRCHAPGRSRSPVVLRPESPNGDQDAGVCADASSSLASSLSTVLRNFSAASTKAAFRFSV